VSGKLAVVEVGWRGRIGSSGALTIEKLALVVV
jgi:hypothetical protein